MLANNRHSFILSLLLALTLVITLANAAIDVNTAHRRQATRMIKKRQGGVAGLLGVGSDPATVTSADTVSQSSTTESSATKETSTSSGTTTTANLISTILSDITRTGGTSTSTSSTSTVTSSSTSVSSEIISSLEFDIDCLIRHLPRPLPHQPRRRLPLQ